MGSYTKRRSKSEKVTEFSLFFLRFLSLFWLFLPAIHSDKAFRKALFWRTFWKKLLTLDFDLNPKKFSDFFEGKALVEESSGLGLVVVGEEVEDFWGILAGVGRFALRGSSRVRGWLGLGLFSLVYIQFWFLVRNWLWVFDG